MRFRPMWRAALLCAALAQAGPTVSGVNGVASCTHFLAADVASDVLREGGTAVDAAAAAQFALAVVEPQHVSVLGGGAFLYHPPGGAASDTVHIDFREEAPNAYTPSTFCKNETCAKDPGCTCPEGAWDEDERCTGGRAVGVPGVPGLFARLLEDGMLTKPLAELVSGAVRLAEDGFVMYEFLHELIEKDAHLLARDEAAREIFLDESGAHAKVPVGSVFKQPLLAATLRRLASDPAGFYRGENAKAIVQAARSAVSPVTGKGGLLEEADLAGYRAVRRHPTRSRYLGFNVTGGAPPFSGGIAIAQTLGIVERVSEFAPTLSTRGLGHFVDAQNAAFADRNEYVADADFVDVPPQLPTGGYLDTRVRELWPSGAQQPALRTPVRPGSPSGARHTRAASSWPSSGTSHMSIIDKWGGVVAMTTTINGLLGSRVAVPGWGVLLNNQLCDFDPVGYGPDGRQLVNSPEGGKRKRRSAVGADAETMGGKRPRSSMSPTIVVPAGHNPAPFRVLAAGAPGGSDIIGGVLNVLRNVLAPGAQPISQLQNATDKPRALGKNPTDGSTCFVELALWNETDTMSALQALGYNVTYDHSPPPYALGETFARVESVALSSSSDLAFGAADHLRFPCARSVATQ